MDLLPVADAVSEWGIGGLAVIVALSWAITWARGDRGLRMRLAVGIAAVMAASALAARVGLLQRFDVTPPPMAIMMASVFALAGAVGGSSIGRSVADNLPFATLVGLQAFRLPLEIVMHRAGRLGIMPVELSYSGYNFDIVTGASALALWALMRRGVRLPRWSLWAWNLWGIYCLGAIAAIAISTSPMVLLFGDDPRHVNTWVLHFPYVWLPAVLVTVAVAAHVVVTRKLLRGARA